MIRTRVNWQFNPGFRVQRTFPSRARALRYAKDMKRIWGLWKMPRLTRVKWRRQRTIHT